MATIEYRAQHIRAPGTTTLDVRKVSSEVPRAGDYVCLADGWASLQVHMVTLIVYEDRWLVDVHLGEADAKQLATLLST